jgi:hypothetical protein
MKRIGMALALAFALTLLVSSLAFAHERRTVGKYDFLVGWINEPAYVNQPNAISLTVTNTDTKKPVDGLDQTIKAEVIVGAKSMPVALTESDETPGLYLGSFIPTRVGGYIFHFTGMVENQKIDEKFESGPNTFNDVEDSAPLDFPDKLASPAQIAAQLQAAQNVASSAQTLAYVGIGAGLLGLIVGGIALTRKK